MSLKLSQGLYPALEEILGSAEEARRQVRAAQVEDAYQTAVVDVFKKAAPLVLKHTNAVYCFEEKGVMQFVIYTDDSSIRSSLDARQEWMKIALYKQGLTFSLFKVLPAQKSIKTRHPFENVQILPQKPVFREISASEMAEIEEFVTPIEDEIVKEAFKQALISDLKTREI